MGDAVSAPQFTPEGATRFEYRFSIHDGHERHDWALHGERGAIGIWASPSNPTFLSERWYGGIECHFAEGCQPDYMGDLAAHDLCWLLMKRCYHDGSSLSFGEQIEPMLPAPTGAPMSAQEQSVVMPTLRSWFRSHMLKVEDEDA